MPKKQPTSAKRARAAVREGAKYTTALRVQPHPDNVARYGWDEHIVTALSEIIADGGTPTVGVIWLDPQPAHEDRWGIAEATAGGYRIREYEHQVHAMADLTKGTRVPVPYRTAEGLVQVAALWPLVHWETEGSPGWQWAHNGWGVEQADGEILDGFNPLPVSADLPYEVRVFHIPNGVAGEDYSGTAPSWEVWAWCAEQAHAEELAQAAVAHRTTARPECGYVRAQVWQHNQYLNVLPDLVHTADASPARPPLPRLPFDTPAPGRPASAGPTPEPVWRNGEKHPPTYELVVWTPEEGWTSSAWFTGGRSRVGVVADLLRVGAGGPYPYAETWGPRHPDTWAHDWTQEGRSLTDYHPNMPNAELSALVEEHYQAEARYLAAALADRSNGQLTVEQATARLDAGGSKYRDFLRIGQVVLLDVLNRQRRELPQGPERTAVRTLIDQLENRHQVAPGYGDLARDLLGSSRDHDTAEMKAFRRRALEEYLAPGPDTTGVPGLPE
ncbi:MULTISPECIES: hypothetical protein [Streptacidiphilus]|uniref:Uncharacterized protein n=1 Tax=Streptacidiphilus cavernicola TaxID=3342716 RepID=A0ABV6UW64_9ACTN|nr:hypothetical protein [Streptacidiphilus jeojiense]